MNKPIEKLSFAISPCPNDTFIFGAIANKLIDLPYDFDFSYHDIETLNKMAQSGEADIIKMSFYNYFQVKDHYRLLPCGGALGRGCGPLLISLDPDIQTKKENFTIAIPGLNTTANFLLGFYKSKLTRLIEMPFDKIESAVLERKCDAGVIIHENRFTYTDKGLQLIKDLGLHWEEKTGSPIPLGCLAVRNELFDEIAENMIKLVQQSILFANNCYNQISDYVAQHAKEMDPNVLRSHIDLYVNEFSYDMGLEGWNAVKHMAKELSIVYE